MLILLSSVLAGCTASLLIVIKPITTAGMGLVIKILFTVMFILEIIWIVSTIFAAALSWWLRHQIVVELTHRKGKPPYLYHKYIKSGDYLKPFIEKALNARLSQIEINAIETQFSVLLTKMLRQELQSIDYSVIRKWFLVFFSIIFLAFAVFILLFSEYGFMQEILSCVFKPGVCG